MSGDTTCYWDPSGQALAQTVKEMRQQAPRGRSVNHTQPDLAQRFKHQWDVWDACSTQPAAIGHQQPPQPHGSDGGSNGSGGVTDSGSQVPHVSDALYLRLPLRLQDHKLQGSAIAAAVGARLGLAGRSMGLSLEDVRAQVGGCESGVEGVLVAWVCVKGVWGDACLSGRVQVIGVYGCSCTGGLLS